MKLPDEDPTSLQGIEFDPARSTNVTASRRRDPRVDDGKGMLSGFVVTLVVHLAVAVGSLRLGRREGNVHVQAAAAPEQVIETHLLKRGGADTDPRRVVHRVTPTLAEREAPRQVALTNDPTQVRLPDDAGAQDYMNAIITGRHRAARGNQDLAEMERIAQMAAAEQAADPTAQPGEGVPSGSAVGDTTDPRLATQGAATKIDEFLRQHIRVTTALTGSEPRRVTFRIRLDATGVIESASIPNPSGNEALDADILTQAQSLAERHVRIESLTPEELTAVSGRNINVGVPIGQIAH